MSERLRTLLSVAQLLVILFGVLFWASEQRKINAVDHMEVWQQIEQCKSAHEVLIKDIAELRTEIRDLRRLILWGKDHQTDQDPEDIPYIYGAIDWGSVRVDLRRHLYPLMSVGYSCWV